MSKNASAKIILHIEDRTKEQQIIRLCSRLNYAVRRLTVSDTAMTLGALSGLASARPLQGVNKPAAKTNIPPTESLPDLIIFAGLSSEELDRFLSSYKQDKIPPTGLKATVTMHNINWTVQELIRELKREQTAILLKGRI